VGDGLCSSLLLCSSFTVGCHFFAQGFQMTSRPQAAEQYRRWITAAFCLLVAAAIIPVQGRLSARLKDLPPDADLLYFNSPRAVKMMSLGYERLVADIYWMRAIQYYGRRDEADRRPVRYKNLPALLEITTTLDPDLLDAYRAGSGFLAEPEPAGAGLPLEAIRLLDQGIRTHPDEWRLYFDKGFVHYWFMNDFVQAGRIWLEASRIKSAPPWMASLAAMGMSQGGEMEMARSLWKRQWEESTRPDVRENAWNHYASVQIDEDLWTLEFFVEKFRLRTGRVPARLEDLVIAGFLRRVPQDPSGVSYLYDAATGIVRQGPKSSVRYLKMPEAYRKSYQEKLIRAFGAP
jgi:hypothetical protein